MSELEQNNNTETGLQDVIKKAHENVQAEIEETQVKKKRGRKPKAEKGLETQNLVEQNVKLEKDQVSMIAFQSLKVLGTLLAKGLKCPDLEFSDEEAKTLGDSMANASQYFMPEIHPKWIAVGGLTVCAGMITFSKMSAYNAHIEKTKPKLDDGVMKKD